LQGIGIEHLIKYRLLEIERVARRILDKIKGTRLKSPHEETIKENLEKNLTSLSGTLEKLSGEITKLKLDSIGIIVDYIRTQSDYLFGVIEDILSQEAAAELYYFLDFYIDFLVDEKIIENSPTIVIIKGYEPQTYLLPSLPSPENPSLSPNESLWIIEVPVKVEGNIFEWPILLHELAHIIEHKLRIVNNKFRRSYTIEELERGVVNAVDYYHCKEYLCDYIALLLCGPLWLFMLYDLYLTPTYRLPKTHPEWTRRVAVLKERISDFLNDVKKSINKYRSGSALSNIDRPLSREGIEQLTKLINNIEQIKLEPVYHKPPHLDQTLNDVENKLANLSFKLDIKDLLNCVSNLAGFKPYISKRTYIVGKKEGESKDDDIDVNVIVNAGYLVYRLNLFNQEILEYFRHDEYKMKSEFTYLVAECVRSARIVMLAKQALLS